MKEKIKTILIIGLSIFLIVMGFWELQQKIWRLGQGIEQKSTELEQRLTELERQNNLSSIVDYWKREIVYIDCFNKDNKMLSGGSGVLFVCPKWSPISNIVAITNKHLPNNDDIDYCNVTVEEDIYPVSKNKVLKSEEYDIGFIPIDEPTESTKEIALSFYGDGRYCNKKIGKIGDEIIILGYPVAGTKDSITVTRGIISGHEDNFYVTDAKIDKGNSGGAAILVKHNCYLGIPTFAIEGSLESFGRILDFAETLLPQ